MQFQPLKQSICPYRDSLSWHINILHMGHNIADNLYGLFLTFIACKYVDSSLIAKQEKTLEVQVLVWFVHTYSTYSMC